MASFRITYTNDQGGLSVICPAPDVDEQLALTALPEGVTVYSIVPVEYLPTDRTFRAAWTFHQANGCVEDLTKAKEITHDRRRAAREVDFAPHDEVIMKQIPGKSAQAAETARALIRAKYTTIQNNIDSAGTVSDLRNLIATEQL